MFGKSKRGSGRGKRRTNKSVVVLAAALLITIMLALAMFVHVSTLETYDTQYLKRASAMRVAPQTIAKFALAATSGDKAAFGRLQAARDEFEVLLADLKNGNKADNLPASPADVPIRPIENSWLELREKVDIILNNEEAILSVGEFVGVITEFIPQLQDFSDQIVKLLIESGADSSQIYIATRQLMLVQRIENNVNRVLGGGRVTAAAIDQFSQDADLFGRVLEGMLKGDAALGVQRVDDPRGAQKLREVAMLFSSVNDHAEEIIDTTPDVLPALEAAGVISEVSDKVNAEARALSDLYSGNPGRLKIGPFVEGPIWITVLGIIAAILLVVLGAKLLVEARRREAESKAVNETNQKAILKLLDEMGDLADGDLTVTATVTEDITGAIADSINYAIEALRNLVSAINDTSDKVSSSAQESRATAMHLAEASEHQAEQITSASDAIQSMAEAMNQMSGDASESADVAQRSVDVATKGNLAVRNTIEGMDGIRDQIQETSKRIKRLGESSQEIGNIVELIDDISDQTNILALNAAMQAAMAGEAGRGFAVVADEVQRLAERSSNATKQIEALVKTIQADTNEAVRSMEASTSGVVSGAKLAEDAGEALQEIETVSTFIADMTGRMADSAQQQAVQATGINDTMNVIQEITTQTSEGTGQTAQAIGTLADLADELQKSVAGFRLPE
ncbi:MAG: methyl-accepting chemotaxis protein [gamma proteobacterium symbiont of Bathyaustriella thionipta]|nr:methyl-accepting chemotaxis protein [gamma proteobacterium symbiont of Bathyaustriella thionipta]